LQVETSSSIPNVPFLAANSTFKTRTGHSFYLSDLRELCTANVLVLVFLRRFSGGKVVVVRESNRDRIDRRPERRSRGRV